MYFIFIYYQNDLKSIILNIIGLTRYFDILLFYIIKSRDSARDKSDCMIVISSAGCIYYCDCSPHYDDDNIIRQELGMLQLLLIINITYLGILFGEEIGKKLQNDFEAHK